MNYRVPELVGEPCYCADCTVAGIAGQRPPRTPDGELHGKAAADWRRERERALFALRAFQVRAMPEASGTEGEGA
jgi:hypothetical protein